VRPYTQLLSISRISQVEERPNKNECEVSLHRVVEGEVWPQGVKSVNFPLRKIKSDFVNSLEPEQRTQKIEK
jgi:hypothetical protein